MISTTDRRPEVIKTCENDVFEMNNLVRLVSLALPMTDAAMVISFSSFRLRVCFPLEPRSRNGNSN